LQQCAKGMPQSSFGARDSSIRSAVFNHILQLCLFPDTY
jgi:hypothetical protein